MNYKSMFDFKLLNKNRLNGLCHFSEGSRFKNTRGRVFSAETILL